MNISLNRPGMQNNYKTREDLDRHQKRCLFDLLTHVWTHSPFYRDLYSDYGIKKSDIGDIRVEDLPIVDKDILMENFDRAVTDNRLKKRDLEKWLDQNRDPYSRFHEDIMVLHGSGSSLHPSIYVYSSMDWQIISSLMSTHLDPEIRDSQKTREALFMTTGGHFGGITGGIQLPKTIYDIMAIDIFESPEQIIKKLSLFQPHRISGYASSVAMLAEWAIAGKLSIQPTVVFVGGDKLTDRMNEKIYRAWGIYAHDIYAATESLYIAIKKPAYKEMLIVEEINILEILDAQNRAVHPGEAGLVHITNLMNYTLPVIRYKLGDFSVKGTGIPDFPHATIREIQGRAYDYLPVLLDNGRQDIIHPIGLSVFYTEGLEEVQFVSKSPDKIVIQYVSQHPIDREVRNEFQSLLDSINASRVRFDVRKVPAIACDPVTGKFRLVVVEGKHALIERPVSIDQFSPKNFLSDFNPAKEFIPFDIQDADSSLPACFERLASQYPDNEAVLCDGDVLKYDALNRKANKLARKILSISDAGQEIVSLFLRHDISMIIGILAVLKAGKAYVPLDPAYPEERLRYFLEDTRSPIVVTDDRDLHLAQHFADNVNIVDIDAIETHFSEENTGLEIPPDSLACILYTSGTTGRPKGVPHSHREILHRILTYTNDSYISRTDRIALLHSCAFSASQRNLFGALLNGACACMFDLKEEGAQALIPWLRNNEITIYYSVPTAFRLFVSFLGEESSFPSLRLIRLGGEPVTAKDALLFQKHFQGGCFFVNALAANETGTISQYFIDKETPIVGELLPVGFTTRDKEIRLLARDGTEIKTEDVGEITVSSRYIAREYWKNPSLTSSAFTIDPQNHHITYRTGDLGRFRSNGCLEYVGRMDDQIQIRGHRVEPLETESVLMQHTDVREAAVTGMKDKNGDTHLVAHIVAKSGGTISVNKLRKFLSSKIPAYMIPSYFVAMDAFPHTDTGKIDKKKLPQPTFERPDLDENFVPPRNPTEAQLVDIWKDLLGLNRIGIHDNFLDLGGHSLTASLLLTRISNHFGVSMSIRSLFEKATIAEMAPLIMQLQTEYNTEKLADILESLDNISDKDAEDLLNKL